ncbi:MAG: hypothetical protein K8E66_03520, partial [Phycisphaerales bacterium]|nr:hypothetical protein [Phycisphaerales bacterium]
RAVVCAVYGVIAFLDVPLVYYSVQLIPGDIHPARARTDGRVLWTVLYWFLPVGLLCLGFIRARFVLLTRERAALDPVGAAVERPG